MSVYTYSNEVALGVVPHERLYQEIGDRAVEVDDGAPGFVYLSEGTMLSLRSYGYSQVRQLMERAGVLFVHNTDGGVARVLAPDPVRLQYFAAQNDIPIELVDAVDPIEKKIPRPVYGATVDSECHPV